jgi:hypothetical protein
MQDLTQDFESNVKFRKERELEEEVYLTSNILKLSSATLVTAKIPTIGPTKSCPVNPSVSNSTNSYHLGFCSSPDENL